MKAIIYILILIIGFSSCNNSITGLYKHEICGNAPDCFLYDFCENGRFKYWYSQDIMGSATLTGNWSRFGDTLILKADPYLFEAETNFTCNYTESLDSCQIQIGLLRKYFKNERDTTYMSWVIKLDNDDKNYVTDDRGLLILPYRPIKTITVRDYLTLLGIKPMIELKDSVLTIPNKSNNIKIYIADNQFEPAILWNDKQMLIKRKKLISILPDSMKNYRPDQYIRIKKKCGNLKEE